VFENGICHSGRGAEIGEIPALPALFHRNEKKSLSVRRTDRVGWRDGDRFDRSQRCRSLREAGRLSPGLLQEVGLAAPATKNKGSECQSGTSCTTSSRQPGKCQNIAPAGPAKLRVRGDHRQFGFEVARHSAGIAPSNTKATARAPASAAESPPSHGRTPRALRCPTVRHARGIPQIAIDSTSRANGIPPSAAHSTQSLWAWSGSWKRFDRTARPTTATKTRASSHTLRAAIRPVPRAGRPFAHVTRGTTTASAVTRSAPARDPQRSPSRYIAAEIAAKPVARDSPASAGTSAKGSTISIKAAYWSRVDERSRVGGSPPPKYFTTETTAT
jgi:hypothetical protein